MSGKVENYFATANTSKGFYNLFDSNIRNLDKLFIFKGGPGTGKSSLMKKIGTHMLNLGYDIEYLHCSSDNHSLDGVIIRSLSVGIVDGTAPHVIEPIAPGAIEEYVNLGVAWDSTLLAQYKTEILSLKDQINGCYLKAYDHFGKALLIHDEWEAIYIKEMDFDKANALTDEIIKEILDTVHFDKESIVMERFFGASTPTGPVDFVENITEPIAKRYFIKGRAGSGKSTMLKKLLATATSRGIDAKVYHCAFDPNSLDMVVLPELDVCIFDSTAPHEHAPTRQGDVIIDMYAKLITPGTDEKYATALAAIKQRYTAAIRLAIQQLAKAKVLHDDLEKFYIEAMDFRVLDDIYLSLMQQILKTRP